ncbi:MAG: hypothetical protein Kow00127_17930 [Bacteroidales bacterium]
MPDKKDDKLYRLLQHSGNVQPEPGLTNRIMEKIISGSSEQVLNPHASVQQSAWLWIAVAAILLTGIGITYQFLIRHLPGAEEWIPVILQSITKPELIIAKFSNFFSVSPLISLIIPAVLILGGLDLLYKRQSVNKNSSAIF